ncbi:sensor histidine kinase [Synechococcus sp. CBW1002]|uniref:sensor histidine kinase n=1 Tax=Synechococcus sp. CBW1002 TaxID=1353134 RepID=UPI0018CE9B7D|nr:ATP-binding protein [Synechococcus sp. CBW1002]QPN61119.1 sensor histidine kinase [Synechococcus sp. CBW1002]
MQVSERFLALLTSQLAQFADREDLKSVVVYLALPGPDGRLSLMPVGQWPRDGRALPAVASDRTLQMPAEGRRWLPLRHDRALLGALQVESRSLSWPMPLVERLEAVAHCLTEALRIDLERQHLLQRQQRQDEQLRLLIHQLRNPLAALRTFAQLLRRRLEQDSSSRPLVDGLLAEERQLNRYVEAISALAPPEALTGSSGTTPLLLPPVLAGPEGQPLEEVLEPLLQRAAATAALQKRPWQGPSSLPSWRGDSGAVAEILANLLENAFRYSPAGAAVGLLVGRSDGRLSLTVWDAGPAIPEPERQAIFGRGVRGTAGQQLAGTGLGLALGRDLARQIGGDLELLIPPSRIDPALPPQGNGFRLSLPAAAEAPPAQP